MILKVKVLTASLTLFSVKIEDLSELDEQDPEVMPGLFQGGF